MKKGLFIILNILSVLIEYLVIYLFFRFILNKVFIISLIMTLIILLLMVLFVVYANIILRKTSIEDKKRPCEEALLKLIDSVESVYNKKFYLHYVSAPQPNPAWCVGNHIYINNEYSSSEVFLPGIIAHELGHAISGISNWTFIPSLKVSTVLSRILHLSIVALINANKKWMKVVAHILYFPYYIINLNNIIFTYHFLREDEITANSIAVKLGYGESLRCYYGLATLSDEDPLFRKSDFYHPSIKNMIKKMNIDMNINKELVNIYSIDNKLILADIDTLTFVVPSHITELWYGSINNPRLVKISSKYVTRIHPGAFRKNPNLEVINLENVKDFPVNCVARLNKLDTIKINDLTILESLYNKYSKEDNRLFVSKIQKVLINNKILKDE